MIGELEPRCSNCDYDMRGLPIPHRCPECGSYVDVERMVWRATLGSVLEPSARIGLGALIGVNLICLIAFSWSRWSIGATLFGLLAILCTAIAFCVRRYRVALGPNGLEIQYMLTLETIRWERISHLTCALQGSSNWAVQLTGPSEARPLPPVFLDPSSLAAFHRSLALAKRRWGDPATAVRTGPGGALSLQEERQAQVIDPVARQAPTRSGPCPWCNFDLAEHPAHSICPQCGNSYTPAMRVWRQTNRSQALWFLCVLAAVVAASGYLFLLFVEERPMTPTHRLLMIVLILAATLTARSRWKWDVRAVWLVSDEQGVELRRRGKTTRVAWAQVLSVRQEGADAVLETTGGSPTIRQRFGNKDEATDFVWYAEKLRSQRDKVRTD